MKKLLKVAVPLLILIGVPLYLCSDSFLGWLVTKAQNDNWSDAQGWTYKVANFYRLTGREERAADVLEGYQKKWPDPAQTPDEALLANVRYTHANVLRECFADLEKTAAGDPAKIAKRDDYRERARVKFEEFTIYHPNDPRKPAAERAALDLR